jgi:hypothetical protein
MAMRDIHMQRVEVVVEDNNVVEKASDFRQLGYLIPDYNSDLE